MVLVSYDKEPCVIRRTLNSYRPKHYNVQKYKKTREKRKKKNPRKPTTREVRPQPSPFFSLLKASIFKPETLVDPFCKKLCTNLHQLLFPFFNYWSSLLFGSNRQRNVYCYFVQPDGVQKFLFALLIHVGLVATPWGKKTVASSTYVHRKHQFLYDLTPPHFVPKFLRDTLKFRPSLGPFVSRIFFVPWTGVCPIRALNKKQNRLQ